MSVSIEGGRVGSSCEEYLKRVIRSGIERVCVDIIARYPGITTQGNGSGQTRVRAMVATYR